MRLGSPYEIDNTGLIRVKATGDLTVDYTLGATNGGSRRFSRMV